MLIKVQSVSEKCLFAYRMNRSDVETPARTLKQNIVVHKAYIGGIGKEYFVLRRLGSTYS